MHIFTTRSVFKTPQWNFETAAALNKNKGHFPTRRWNEFHDVNVRFDTIPECDWQTDGFAIIFWIKPRINSSINQKLGIMLRPIQKIKSRCVKALNCIEHSHETHDRQTKLKLQMYPKSPILYILRRLTDVVECADYFDNIVSSVERSRQAEVAQFNVTVRQSVGQKNILRLQTSTYNGLRNKEEEGRHSLLQLSGEGVDIHGEPRFDAAATHPSHLWYQEQHTAKSVIASLKNSHCSWAHSNAASMMSRATLFFNDRSD